MGKNISIYNSALTSQKTPPSPLQKHSVNVIHENYLSASCKHHMEHTTTFTSAGALPMLVYTPCMFVLR